MRVALAAGFAGIVAAAVAGCFNPDLGDGLVSCGVGGSCPPGYSCDSTRQRCVKMLSSTDMTVMMDMAGTGGGGGGGGGGDGGGMPRDMAGGCGADGTRVCIDDGHSAVCMNNVAVVDRTCPPMSACMGGHCVPQTATTCTSSKSCMTGTVCTMFNNNGAVAGFCVPPIAGAAGGAGATCSTAGYDNTCKTGICASPTGNPTLKDCLYPCLMNGDCGGGFTCTSVVGMPSTIEGAPVGALKFCN